ncbi:MAG TPA: transcription termination/antitermination protein NusG [Pirellulales bacterium]
MTDETNQPTDEPKAANPQAADPAALSGEGSAPVEGSTNGAAPAEGAPVGPMSYRDPVGTGEAPKMDGESDDDSSADAEPIDEVAAASPAAGGAPPAPEPTGERNWYILKVQSNREDSIRDALLRRVKIAGLLDFFGDIIVPIEMVSEFKAGKKRVVKRKLYPGYIMVNMELNEDTWFLVRETPGIGDFTGSGGKPSPMLSSEVNRIITNKEEAATEQAPLKIKFKPSDRVKITEGTFENFEGDVDSIDQSNGRVTVMINIFGRSTPVELEYWQIESI